MIRIRSLLPSVASIACLAILTATSVGAAPMLAPGLSSVTPPGELLLMFDDMGNGTISVGGGSPGSLPGTLIDDPADPA